MSLDLSLRIAAMLALTALCVELVSWSWNSPTAFIVSVGVGGVSIALGLLYFFFDIVAVPRPNANQGD